MAWSFGDSFDLYAAPADMLNGYWDSAGAILDGCAFVAGRFAGSRALQIGFNAGFGLVKTSGVNDAVHHFVVSFLQTGAISGSTLCIALQLQDGSTSQCSVVFRSDGAILLTSGGGGGSTLATYTGAFPVTNTWYAFEFEVVISNTAGSFAVRKNGNSVNDFFLGSLNTRGGTANNYANKLDIIVQSITSNNQNIDDLFWQSGAATGAWLGDIRCYARMPASDASAHFLRSPAVVAQVSFPNVTLNNVFVNQALYTPFTAVANGAIGTVIMPLDASGSTASFKCAIYASSGGVPTTVLGSATPVSAPPGNTSFTFPTPVPVVQDTQYFVAFNASASSGFYGCGGSGLFNNSSSYASFPASNPVTSSGAVPPAAILNITPTTTANFTAVNEPRQDGLTAYVYDSNPGDADFYGIASIASTPAVVIATTVRAYTQKSDVGTRTLAVQLKSGATTVASPTLVLTTSGFQWAWRTDLVDPNTGAAWTAAGVNNAQCGPKIIA